MMKKQFALLIIAAVLLIASVSAVFAATSSRTSKADAEQACVAKPASGFSFAMVTESAVYLFSGGIGPILMLALVAVISAIVSHLIWSGF